MVLVAVVPPIHEETMSVPGANMSRQVPKLEYPERESVVSPKLNAPVAPTVMALGAREGELLHAFVLLFPAATAMTTPSLITFCTAVSSAVFALPPRLMLATAGLPAT